jgi:glycosyltransferase involved in cell wall biosynthesis
MPKVSVVIPVFNGEHFIQQTIESVLAQTFQDFEIIVVDDGSTDNTAEIVKGFGGKVTYQYQANAGADIAYNAGIASATGEFVAFLDHDDAWHPEKLARQVAILDRHPGVGLTYTELEYVDEEGRLLNRTTWVEKRKVKGDLTGDFRSILFNKFPCAIPSAMMIRRNILNQVGGFDPDLPPNGHGDVEMCILAGQISQLYFTITPLTQYRMHRRQMTHQRHDEIHANYIILLDALWSRWRNRPDARALLLRLYGRHWSWRAREALKRGDRSDAMRCAKAAIRYNPYYLRPWIRLLKAYFLANGKSVT